MTIILDGNSQAADHKLARQTSTVKPFIRAGASTTVLSHGMRKPDRDGEQPADQDGRRTTGQSAGATSSAAGPLSRVVRLNSTR